LVGRLCPGRIILRDGKVKACPIILTDGPTHCDTHKRVYGPEHWRLRAEWKKQISNGSVKCATCRVLLEGNAWDLGHTDDRTGYVGPQCRRCNRSDGAKRKLEA
jgi:hypothetical protein